jgi:hypothetical protein
MYRLGQISGVAAQNLLWAYINDGLLDVAELDDGCRRWMQHYMTVYADRPCDLADASLLAIAEALDVIRVFTIDSDFYIYVLSNGSVLDVAPGPMAARKPRK